MNHFKKKYQVWEYAEGQSYSFTEFDTLQEAIEAPKHGDWYVTKSVDIKFKEQSTNTETPSIEDQVYNAIVTAFQFDENGYLQIAKERGY